MYYSSSSDLYSTDFQDPCFSCVDYADLPEDVTAYWNLAAGIEEKNGRGSHASRIPPFQQEAGLLPH